MRRQFRPLSKEFPQFANARLVARFAEAEGENSAAAAVPVTVWVKPEHAGR
ncbi:MAG: hypothetical protein ACOX1P_01200 [Thermoguttaceae bacterium]